MFDLRVDGKTALTQVALQDADALFALTDASRDYLREWLPWVDATRSVDNTHNFIRTCLEQHARNNGFHCCIWYDNRLAGVVGFLYADWINRKTELGYWLGPAFQGLGIMTKCCRSLVAYAFEVLEMNRVEIHVAVENHKSRAIPERLGFVQEGVIRDAEWLYDHYVDNAVYGMLRRDWTPI